MRSQYVFVVVLFVVSSLDCTVKSPDQV